jgi:hypothetical protein
VASPPADFFGAPFFGLHVNADGRGLETAIWTREPDGGGHALQAATRSPSGPFNSEQTVLANPVGAPIAYPDLTMSADGWALIAFVNAGDNRTAAASLRPPGGSFGPVRLIAGEQPGTVITGGIDVGGLAAVAWDAADGIQVSAHPPADDFSPPRTFGSPGAGFPALAFDGRGRGVLAWSPGGAGLELSTYRG